MAFTTQGQEVNPQLTSSLTSFYDNVVYWEIAKNTNKFFVTFEKGLRGIPNNKQESIGTMEIDYPHVNSNTGSSNTFNLGVTRNVARYDTFLEEEEKHLGNNQNYNGFITTTELKGTRFFQTDLTSSIFQPTTHNYEIYDGSNTVTATRTVSASYFYPYSSHQLSVLRKSPTLIVDLDISNELPNGVGDKGFVLIPEHTHPTIKANLNKILLKAGYGK
tara:strand:- start:4145 stop:4798 length:654 start_codon:yes stop_codon:yes gene_type:complete